MEFPRQEYWSGAPFPSLGDLPDPGIEPEFLASPVLAGGFLARHHLGSPLMCINEDSSRICFVLHLGM